MTSPFLQLVIMRHAKSSWADAATSDHARPLNDRGRLDAPRVATRLVELGWVPDRVVSSDSKRTQETWARMADQLPPDIEITFTRRLYHAGIERFREVVAEQPSDCRTLLVLGHNPGWEEVVQWLCGEPVTLTTANAVLLRHDTVPWSQALAPDAWSLVDVLRPREL